MKKSVYEAPCAEVMEMQVEQCILSSSYGEPGDPGQGSGYLDFGEDV